MASSALEVSDDTLHLLTFTPVSRQAIEGIHINLVPLSTEDIDPLWPLISGPENDNLWTYMPVGPFNSYEVFAKCIEVYIHSTDPLFWAIVDRKSGQRLGYISFLRIDNANRTIEIGHVLYTRLLQRTTAASEAWFLLARTAFESGYRRLEWKCNDKNEPSRRAALRYGHTFEGIFRQHMLVKGENRDTAWFSIINGEWPVIRKAFETWIDGKNFDEGGRQLKSLQQIRDGLQSVSSP